MPSWTTADSTSSLTSAPAPAPAPEYGSNNTSPALVSVTGQTNGVNGVPQSHPMAARSSDHEISMSDGKTDNDHTLDAQPAPRQRSPIVLSPEPDDPIAPEQPPDTIMTSRLPADLLASLTQMVNGSAHDNYGRPYNSASHPITVNSSPDPAALTARSASNSAPAIQHTANPVELGRELNNLVQKGEMALDRAVQIADRLGFKAEINAEQRISLVWKTSPRPAEERSADEVAQRVQISISDPATWSNANVVAGPSTVHDPTPTFAAAPPPNPLIQASTKPSLVTQSAPISSDRAEFYVPLNAAQSNTQARPGDKIPVNPELIDVIINFTPTNNALPSVQLGAIDLLHWLSFIIPHNKLVQAAQDIEVLKRQGAKHADAINHLRNILAASIRTAAQTSSSAVTDQNGRLAPSQVSQVGFGSYANLQNLPRARGPSPQPYAQRQPSNSLHSIPRANGNVQLPPSHTLRAPSPSTGNYEPPEITQIRSENAANQQAISQLMQSIWEAILRKDSEVFNRVNTAVLQLRTASTPRPNDAFATDVNALRTRLDMANAQVTRSNEREAEALSQLQAVQAKLDAEKVNTAQLLAAKNRQGAENQSLLNQIAKLQHTIVKDSDRHKKEIDRMLAVNENAREKLVADVKHWQTQARQATQRPAELQQAQQASSSTNSSPVFGKVAPTFKAPVDANAETAALRVQLQKRTDRMREVEEEKAKLIESHSRQVEEEKTKVSEAHNRALARTKVDHQQAIALLRNQHSAADHKLESEWGAKVKELEETVKGLKADPAAKSAAPVPVNSEETKKLQAEIVTLKAKLAANQNAASMEEHEEVKKGFEKMLKWAQSLRRIAKLPEEPASAQSGSPADRAQATCDLMMEIVKGSQVNTRSTVEAEQKGKMEVLQKAMEEQVEAVKAEIVKGQQAELETAQKSLEEVKKELSLTKMTVATVKNELEAAKESAKSKGNELDAVKVALDETRKELEAVKNDLDKTRKELEESQKAGEELREEALAGSQVPVASASPKKARDDQADDARELEEIREQLADRERECDDLQMAKEELEQNLTESLEARYKARDETSELEKELDKVKGELGKWKEIAMRAQADLRNRRTQSPAVSVANGVQDEPATRSSSVPQRSALGLVPSPAPATPTSTNGSAVPAKRTRSPLFLPNDEMEQEPVNEGDEPVHTVTVPRAQVRSQAIPQFAQASRKRRRIMSEEASPASGSTSLPAASQAPSVSGGGSVEPLEPPVSRPVTREWVKKNMKLCLDKKGDVQRCKLCFVQSKKAASTENRPLPTILDIAPLAAGMTEDQVVDHLIGHEQTLRRLKDRRIREGKDPASP